MRKLSVLVIHNQYQQPGGEDVVVRAEVEMLRRAGHRVVQFIRNNAAIANLQPSAESLSGGEHDMEPERLHTDS